MAQRGNNARCVAQLMHSKAVTVGALGRRSPAGAVACVAGFGDVGRALQCKGCSITSGEGVQHSNGTAGETMLGAWQQWESNTPCCSCEHHSRMHFALDDLYQLVHGKAATGGKLGMQPSWAPGLLLVMQDAHQFVGSSVTAGKRLQQGNSRGGGKQW
jgi:hypothetical protein